VLVQAEIKQTPVENRINRNAIKMERELQDNFSVPPSDKNARQQPRTSIAWSSHINAWSEPGDTC